MMTPRQAKRLLDILGCDHDFYIGVEGEPMGRYIDHVLDHVEELMKGKVDEPA